ncbi:hypothetical protein CJI97_003747 [Candidozyma auris]|nr:hypothetical protein CJI97_003747 [[Candida] auris]
MIGIANLVTFFSIGLVFLSILTLVIFASPFLVILLCLFAPVMLFKETKKRIAVLRENVEDKKRSSAEALNRNPQSKFSVPTGRGYEVCDTSGVGPGVSLREAVSKAPTVHPRGFIKDED